MSSEQPVDFVANVRLYVEVVVSITAVFVHTINTSGRKPLMLLACVELSSKIRLMRSLATTMFPYACELWTLTAELQRRIQAMEMRCYRKILHISYKNHVTNYEVRAKV